MEPSHEAWIVLARLDGSDRQDVGGLYRRRSGRLGDRRDTPPDDVDALVRHSEQLGDLVADEVCRHVNERPALDRPPHERRIAKRRRGAQLREAHRREVVDGDHGGGTP